jgi:hypothetical protein
LPFLSCGSFVAAMAITTGVLMVGAMAWVFVVGRVEQVNWAAAVLQDTAGPGVVEAPHRKAALSI